MKRKPANTVFGQLKFFFGSCFFSNIEIIRDTRKRATGKGVEREGLIGQTSIPVQLKCVRDHQPI